MNSLLEPEFLRILEALRRRFSSDVRSGDRGEGVAPRRGGNAEFYEHRPYVAGDDLRRVDWLAYARSGEPVVKLFRAEEDTVVRLLVDASASLGFGTPSKLLVAQRIAAALAYLALATSERAQVLVAQELEPGRSLSRVGAAHRGRSAFAEVARQLASLEAKGRNDLAAAIGSTLQRFPRPGLLVVLSDFFDPGAFPTALRRARAAGHQVVLVQILDPAELEPELDGDYVLEDAETGAELAITLDTSALSAYAIRLSGLFEELRSWARQNSACYVRLRTTDELEPVIRRILTRAID